MKENTINLQVVLSDGRIIHTVNGFSIVYVILYKIVYIKKGFEYDVRYIMYPYI